MEVVRRGFMSNFLFQNISQIFGGMPKEVMDIINNFEAIEEPAKKVNFSEEVKEDLQLDDDGNVNLSDDYVLNKQAEIFGNKIYETSKDINDAVKEITQEDNITRSAIEDLKQSVKEGVKTEIIDNIKEEYADKLKASDEKRIQSILNNATDRLIDKTIQNYQIEKNVIEKERTEALQSRFESGKSTEEINEEFDKKQKEQDLKLQTDFSKVRFSLWPTNPFAIQT